MSGEEITDNEIKTINFDLKHGNHLTPELVQDRINRVKTMHDSEEKNDLLERLKISLTASEDIWRARN